MAVLFIDSFGHYNTQAQGARKWNSMSSANTYSSSTPRFTSNQYIRNPTSITYVSPSTQTSGVLGFAFYLDYEAFPVNSPFVAIGNTTDNANHIRLFMNSAGKMYVGLGSGTTAINSQVASKQIRSQCWHYIEWSFVISTSTASGDCVIRMDGEEVFNLATSQNTKGATTGNWDRVMFLSTGAFSPCLFDDIYISDQNTPNGGFLTCPRVLHVMPNGAGNYTQWTASTGSNFQCVDETPVNDDTDYVSTSTAGNIDTYNFTDISTAYTVKAVQNVMCVRKDDAGSRSIASVVRSGGSDFVGTTQTVADSYLFLYQIYNTDPNTAAAWTPTNLNSAEFGIKLIA